MSWSREKQELRRKICQAARQIAQVQRDERQHAGREKAQKALEKDCQRRNACLHGKSHSKHSFPLCGGGMGA